MLTTQILEPLLIAALYALFLFVSTDTITSLRKYASFLINITAGLVFTYVFLTMLPEIFLKSELENIPFIVFILFCGYMAFYIAEKKTFSETNEKKTIEEKIIAIRTGGFYIVHFITGYLIVYTFSEGSLLHTLLLLFPFTFDILTTTLLYEDLHKWVKESLVNKLIFPGLILIGAICALITTYVLGISLFFFYAFFGGTFIYLVTTLLPPHYKKGNITWLLLGVFLYLVLMFIGG